MTSTTVSDMIERLSPTIVVGVAGPLASMVTDVIVTDPVFPAELRAGMLVVAPGFRWGDEACDALIETAVAAGASAIALKASAMPATDECPVAIVVIEPAADWARVVAILRSASLTTGTPAGIDEDSLFGLADALASMCGGPVVLLDPAWQLLAYSGGAPQDDVRNQTILARRAPAIALDGLRRNGVLAAIGRGEIVQVADGEVEGLSRRFAVAARAGSEVLATVWCQPNEVVELIEVETRLRQAADFATLMLLRHAASNGQVNDSAHDVAFHDLLIGDRTERLVADRLGVDDDSGFVLAGLRPTAEEDHERAATVRRLVTLARTHCDAYRINAQIASSADATYLLFVAPDIEHRRGAVRVVTDMHARLQKTAPHRAMVSSTFRALTSAPAVRQTVDELLLLSERRGWNILTDSDDVEASWRLEQFREVALAHPSLLSGPIVRLSEHDRAQGTEFVPTLRAYFEAVGDMRVVAERLGLHVNTVRYRINKAQDIAEFSLDRSDERLLAELQIRLLS